jgi:dolichyl-phosphate beta-glucosyltransferase
MPLPLVSLVIPCFNEAERLPQLYEGLKYFIAGWGGNFEVIIINDGSDDDTLNLLQQESIIVNLISDNKCILINQNNLGKGGALQKGVAIAKGTYILTLDADMSTDPLTLLDWLALDRKLFVENKVLIASRALPESKLILISDRREKGKIFNKIIRTITDLPFKDTQCGFKLYPSSVAKEIFVALNTKGWAHDIELLLRLKKMKISVNEMPIT